MLPQLLCVSGEGSPMLKWNSEHRTHLIVYVIYVEYGLVVIPNHADEVIPETGDNLLVALHFKAGSSAVHVVHVHSRVAAFN